jgi:hypothetical protein
VLVKHDGTHGVPGKGTPYYSSGNGFRRIHDLRA